MLAARISPRQEMAAHVARAISKGRCEAAGFERIFGLPLERAFGPRLQALAGEGAVARDGDAWTRPSRGEGASYLELLAALGTAVEELRSPPARAAMPPLPWAPRCIVASAVHVASPPGAAEGTVDLIDDPHVPPAHLPEVISAARGAGATDLALWTHPDRLEDEGVRRELEGALPDLLMLDVEGTGARWRAVHAWASPKTATGLLLRVSPGEVGGLPVRLQGLAMAGVARVLVELEAPVTGELALDLWRIAARRRPEIAITFGDEAMAWSQYGQVSKAMPDSILISRIAFRAARANRRRDGGFARFHRRFGRL